MAVMAPQTKRIKLEHSYAFSQDSTNGAEPMMMQIKEEDPLECETIKIEIDDDKLVKTEPIDEVLDESYNFDYSSIVNDDNQQNDFLTESTAGEFSEGHSVIKSEIDTEGVTRIFSPVTPVPPTPNPVLCKDPLEIINKYELFLHKEIIPVVLEKQKEKKNSKSNKVKSEAVEAYERLQKEKDNLQKQIKKLRSELKSTKAREKALQTELGARRMAELCLQEKNNDLSFQLQESLKTELVNSKRMRELNQRLIQTEAESAAVKRDCSERLAKDYDDRLQKLKLQVKNKEFDYKQIEKKCNSLNRALVCLTTSVNSQKTEMDQVKQKLLLTEKQYTESVKSVQIAKQRAAELTKDSANLQRKNEELQKSLLTEKKMSRFFVQERDQLLEIQDTRFREADKELAKMKQITKRMNGALIQKNADCVAQKEAFDMMLAAYKKDNVELKKQMEELRKKEAELLKKSCEYCGF